MARLNAAGHRMAWGVYMWRLEFLGWDDWGVRETWQN